ncbi:MAG: hypothetical protein HY815_18825 [Candidatus Riflebacteria bacterium]|nr:hypothetical protein [Candidatus Riflebacteria bacterium]
MTSFPFTLACFIVACVSVSIVYSLTSPGSLDKVVKETLSSFGLMFGGIIALAVAIVLIPWLFGR